MEMIEEIPTELEGYLRGYVVRRRWFMVWRFFGVGLGVGLLWMLGACAADRVVKFSGVVRGILLGVDVIGVGAILFYPVRQLFRREMDWAAAAAQIEKREPRFAGRLETAVSRLMGPMEHRGSDLMLKRVIEEASEEVRRSDPSRLVRWRAMRGPWVCTAGVLVVMGAFSFNSWLGLGQLMQRFARPWAEIGPVTMTRIEIVSPAKADMDVSQGESVEITARAAELGESSLMLYVSKDGDSWSSSTMMAQADGSYAAVIGPVDRDLSYYIGGGDATTATHSVRALRRPVVTEFRIRYTYLAYTNRQPLTVTNGDGLIEAPVGTEAVVTITASEPLQSAAMVLPDKTIPMTETVEGTVRQAKITINKDQTYRIDLLSTRKVAGATSGPMYIRAVPDRPPLVRISQPTEDLRLGPRYILPVQYQAMDDYGIASLSVQIVVNGGTPTIWPVAIRGDRRRQQEEYNLDLATMPLKIGDMVSYSLMAKDAIGQTGTSETRSILISPRAIDLNWHLRIVELKRACQWADALVKDLESAKEAFAESRNQNEAFGERRMAAFTKLNQSLAEAEENNALLRQSLLRTIVRSDTASLSVGLADLLDKALVQSLKAENAATLMYSSPGRGNSMGQRLSEALSQAKGIGETIKVITRGQQAAAILMDRENLLASERAPKSEREAERYKQTVERARQDMAAEATGIGLNPQAGNIETQLRGCVEAAQKLLASQAVIDFAPISREWARNWGRLGDKFGLMIDKRLAAAAEAEAVRPDADLVRARDLQLASRAAEMLQATITDLPTTGPGEAMTEPRVEYPLAMIALHREHWLNRQNQTSFPAAQIEAIRSAGTAARQKMAAWAGETEGTGTGQANEMAMQANADTAQRNYEKATEMDRRMVETLMRDAPTTRETERIAASHENIKQAMNSAKKLDELAAQQKELAGPVSVPAGAELARRQQQIAAEIESHEKTLPQPTEQSKDSEVNSRQQALATIQSAQELLAAMPQQLANVQQAAETQRQVADQATMMRQTINAVPPENEPVMRRLSEQADLSLLDARERTQTAAKPVYPNAIESIRSRLAPFSPETAAAVIAIDEQLLPAAREIQQTITRDDSAGVKRSTNQAMEAITLVQGKLRKAQAELMDRDPLVAAKAFAQAAADALSQQPPNMESAKQQQNNTAQAISRAWDNTIHQAAAERLSIVPGMGPLYQANSYSSGAGPSSGDGRGNGAAVLPKDREWGQLHRREGEGDLSAPVYESDPPGYQEMLRVYFETLSKTQGEKK